MEVLLDIVVICSHFRIFETLETTTIELCYCLALL